jgi:predicted NUDIX family NTP pyrophosphohydrolase
MRPVGGALEDHDHEFDEVGWFQLEEALELMTHVTERGVVEEAAARLGARPAAGSTASAVT